MESNQTNHHPPCVDTKNNDLTATSMEWWVNVRVNIKYPQLVFFSGLWIATVFFFNPDDMSVSYFLAGMGQDIQAAWTSPELVEGNICRKLLCLVGKTIEPVQWDSLNPVRFIGESIIGLIHWRIHWNLSIIGEYIIGVIQYWLKYLMGFS